MNLKRRQRVASVSRPVPPATRANQKRKHSRGHRVTPLRVLVSMALKNLFFKKLRTTLTVLGVVIGIGAVTFLLSFGYGLQNLVTKQVVGSKSITTVDVTSPRSKILKLDAEGIGRLKSLGSVENIGKVYNVAGKAKLANSQTSAVLYGVDKAYVDLTSFTYTNGQPLTTTSNEQALVNTSFLKAAGITDTEKALNQTLTLTYSAPKDGGGEQTVTHTLKVQGVIDSGSGVEVYASSALFESDGLNDASALKLLASNQNAVPQVRKEIEALGYSTTSPLDTVDQINQIFTLLQFVLVGFGGIGMIIAVLGMFNTLTIALLERTREIGLMITLGAQQKDISRLFTVEALLLSSIGGAIGLIGAFLLGSIGNVILNSFAHSRGVTETISAFSFSPLMVIGTLLISSLLGWIVVYFPARRASRINPIDAIRFE